MQTFTLQTDFVDEAAERGGYRRGSPKPGSLLGADRPLAGWCLCLRTRRLGARRARD